MSQPKCIVFACFIFCFFGLKLEAQRPAGEGIHLYIGSGAVTYTGDLSEADVPMLRALPYLNAGITIAGKGWIQPRVGVGFGAFTEQVDGNSIPTHPDITSTDYVRTTFSNLDGQLQFVLRRKKRLSFSLGVGLGLLFFTPRNIEGDFLIDNPFTRQIGEEYPGVALSFPLSAAINIKLRPQLGLRLAYTYRPTNSDYLDNIGLLGTRAGNDRLQTVSVGFWVGLRPPAMKNAPISPTTKKEKANRTIASRTPAKAVERSMNKTKPQKKAAKPEVDYVALEEKALKEKKYTYHRVEKKEKLKQIAERYHVRIETLRRINFLIDDEIVEGSLLRIPFLSFDE